MGIQSTRAVTMLRTAGEVPIELKLALEERFLVEREIGRGGMATVFLAHDLRDERDVAIKVLHDDLAAAIGSERFRREIQIASRLAHPNILSVLESGAAAGMLYCVMPLVQGESLRALLGRVNQLPVDQAIAYTLEIADALDYSHREGFVHRDIKPENILLENGHALVADFGIARAIGTAAKEDKITQTGVTLGTAAYMSPEQAAAEPAIDGRSDIYALGCVLYEMLAGQPPFIGATANAVMARHALESPPPISVVRATVSDAVEDVLMRALAKSPADRFPTAAAMADALRAAALSPPATGARARHTAQGRAAAARRTRRLRALATASAVVLFSVTAWVLARRWPTDAEARAMSTADATLARRIAVRYFVDRTGGKLAHVADGLTESLIDALSRVRELDVISANGVAPFRAETVPRDSIVRALRVGSLVEGTVEEAGNSRWRVTVRLIDARSGVDLDRATFEGPAAEVLSMRDSVAGDVARFLRSHIGEEIRLRTSRAGTSNVNAWMLLQRASRARKDAESSARGGDATAAARLTHDADSLAGAAGALDPAWAEPSVERSRLAFTAAKSEKEPLAAARWIDQGTAHAEHALALDRTNAAALEYRGALRYLRWLRHLARTPEEQERLLALAEADLRESVRLNPAQANAWNLLSHLSFQKPDFIEAKLAAIRAYETDAYLTAAPDIVWRLYTASYELEQFPDALKWCAEGRRRFAANPRFVQCRLWLMTAKATTPDPAHAWVLVDSLLALTPPPSREYTRRVGEVLVAAALANAGRADSARRVLDRAHPTAALDPEGEIISYEAFVRTLAGDDAGAIRLIKQYLTLKPEHRQGLAVSQSWWWRDLRRDPRFQAVVGSGQ